MQRAQIEKLMKAGTEVAVRTRGGQDFPTYGVYKGVIVAMDAPYRSYKRGGYHGSQATDGIRVRFDRQLPALSGTDWSRVVSSFRHGREGDELEETNDRVVPSRLIIGTWADYERQLTDHEAARAKAQTERAEAEARREQQRLDCEAAVKRLREYGVSGIEARYFGDWRAGYYRVLIPAAVAEAYADLLASTVNPTRGATT